MAQFEENNKAAEKWTLEASIEAFEKMLSNAKSDKDILCYNDACQSINMRYTTAEYLCIKHPVLDDFKKDIQMAIVSRINKGSLTGDYVPTPAIWRMKQLGETDQQQINHQNNGGKFEPSFVVNTKDTADGISKLLNGE